MTTETRIFLEPRDVQGIEVACPECRLSVFYPIDVKAMIKIGPNCFHCGHKLFDQLDNRQKIGGGISYPGIDSIQEIAGHLRALKRQDRTDIHADIRFRLDEGSAQKDGEQKGTDQ